MHRMMRYLLALTLVLCGFNLNAFADNVYAALHGTVTDSTGAVIPDATVTVVNTSTGITTVRQADKKGYFIFPQLQVGGPYSVTISAPGFQSFVSSGLTLNVNDNREVVDIKLQVGAASQTVEVTATAVQVETSDTQLKQIATADQLEGIPLEGRDPAGLGKLSPGVVESSDRFGSFSSNGSQTPQNSYLVNGTDINDGPLQNEGIQVNPDALEEENIVTSTLNPEFARNSGQVVNQILKAGTNQFHGSGFEFYRDTFLNNGNYFSATRPQFHQNLYGGTLGGPVVKGKLFFFAAYQGLRNRTGQTTVQQTLTSDQFNGAFSANSNYYTGASDNTPTTWADGNSYSDGLTENPLPFALGSCPAGETWAACFDNGGTGSATVNVATTQWNSIASKMITQFVPQANYLDEYYDFNAGASNAQDQGILRADFTPTSKDTIWASSIFQSSPGTSVLTFGGGSFPGFGSVSTEHFKIFSASWTHTFGASMLNELRGGYYRLLFPSVIPQTPVQPSSYGFAINPQLSQAGLPFMSVGNYFNLGFSYEGPQPRLDSNMSYADNFSLIRGNHSLKFGASFEQFRVHNPFGYLNNGYYYNSGGGEYSSGDPLLDFVLGIPDGYEQTSDGFIDAVAAERYAYAQDNWKVTPTVTINYGIAWDSEEPNQNRQFGGLGIICWQNTSATSQIFPGGPPGLFYPGDSGCNSAGSPPTHYDHFGPRVGFAWSPESGPSKLIGAAGAHDFSIRGGFGVYYNRDQEEQSLQNLVDPPFLFTSYGAGDFGGSPSFANPYADVAGNGSETNPFPFTAPASGGAVNWGLYYLLNLSAFDKSYDVPYVYNFNLNIERALPSNMVAQISYVGSLGRRLASWYEGDPITQAGHDACLSGAPGSSLPGIGTCSGNLRTTIHEHFPQYTAQPAIVPGTGGGAIPSLPNGLPWYTSLGVQNTEGTSNYNSLQASLIKSPTHGLQFTAAYTYSHALDDGSGYESSTGGAGRVRNWVPGYEYLNYGDSDFDARQRLALSYVYTVPVAGILRSNTILRETLSGWGLAGISAFQTGFPVGISMGTDRSLWCDASYFGCPDVPETSNFKIATHDPRSSADHMWFDTSSFSSEPVGTFGNTKRNFFHGPGFNYTNIQVSKNIPFSADGKRYVQLRLEAFNAFNHANFANPDGTFSSSSFGQITSVDQSADPNGDPSPGRSVQLVGKFFF
ncbi:MAG: carboxypeptidase-like regulatory domain-containing protein [Terracidiphilus sp.]